MIAMVVLSRIELRINWRGWLFMAYIKGLCELNLVNSE